MGLDPDLNKINIFWKLVINIEFNKAIIDATMIYVLHTNQSSFYDVWEFLVGNHFRRLLIIYQGMPYNCCAKRGDIGNTSLYYAKTFLRLIPVMH